MLTAFTAGLLLITISELGDKTFFMAVILAMRHSRRLVFLGVIGALAAMTILSVSIGQIFAFLPQRYIHATEIGLFLVFGVKLLYEAGQMTPQADEKAVNEAKAALEQCNSNHRNALTVLAKCFSLTFVAEWGDRTQIATIALAASNNAFGVTLGATLGHAICTAIAVLGGCLIAGKISERTITALGGLLFLLFAGIAIVEGV